MRYIEKWRHRFLLKPNLWIYIPTTAYLHEGRRIKKGIEKSWHCPDYYYHLRAGGHVRALRSHLQDRYFISLDIRDFFGSISRNRALRCLKKYFHYEHAKTISAASTVRHPGADNHTLPFGFVQSPIIASLCLRMSRLGQALDALQSANKMTVSVYMDDIIVSSNEESQLADALAYLSKASEKSRFIVNKEKTQGPSRKVTVFNVDLSRGSLKISKNRMKRFLIDYHSSANPQVRSGIISYVGSINKGEANWLGESTAHGGPVQVVGVGDVG